MKIRKPSSKCCRTTCAMYWNSVRPLCIHWSTIMNRTIQSKCHLLRLYRKRVAGGALCCLCNAPIAHALRCTMESFIEWLVVWLHFFFLLLKFFFLFMCVLRRCLDEFCSLTSDRRITVRLCGKCSCPLVGIWLSGNVERQNGVGGQSLLYNVHVHASNDIYSCTHCCG